MMNIESLDRKTTFNNIIKGQFFIEDGVIYIKTANIVDEENIEYNAISTKSGNYAYFDPDYLIDEILKGEYIVDFD